MSRSKAVDSLAEARMYIGGAWAESSDGSTLDCVDPTTEEVVATIPNATADDVDRAVTAGTEALDVWTAMPPGERANLILAWADRIDEYVEDLAEIDAVDMGNPIEAMRNDVAGATQEMRMFAGLATELKGSSSLNGIDQFAYGLLEPYGVVGRIIPFNHPFKFAAGKSAPALVAGNAVVLKPSEHASLSAIRLAELSEDLIPSGVFNVVTGDGRRSGFAIADHPGIPRVAFTGSVPTGKAVMRTAAEHVKHVSLELGGKNPMVVFPDVDLDKVTTAAIKGMNFARSQGQSCQSTSRVYVHRDILSDFTDRVVALVSDLEVGDPMESTTDLGPLAFRSHYEHVLSLIDAGLEDGATLLTGGKSEGDRGFFVDPVVFGNVGQDMRIAREEIFGPVMALLEWSEATEVTKMANDTQFGLTAAIWTENLSAAHRMARDIQAGYVWINGSARRVPGTPFGGYKESGIGKESSLEELLSYCRSKTIVVSI